MNCPWSQSEKVTENRGCGAASEKCVIRSSKSCNSRKERSNHVATELRIRSGVSPQHRNTWPLGAVTPQCVRAALLSRPPPRSSCRKDYSAMAHELVQPSCLGLGTRRESGQQTSRLSTTSRRLQNSAVVLARLLWGCVAESTRAAIVGGADIRSSSCSRDGLAACRSHVCHSHVCRSRVTSQLSLLALPRLAPWVLSHRW